MVQAFSAVLQMSFVGSIAILAVLTARLALRKTPRWISYGLWLVVLFRLLCPWSPEGPLSLIPRDLPQVSATAAAGLDTTPLYAAEALVETAVDLLDGQPVSEIMADVGPDWMPTRLHWPDILLLAAAWVWPLGMGVLILWELIGYLRLRLRLLATVSKEGRVIEVAGLQTAFVLGIFRPTIYLPPGLTDRERPYILLHEQTHVRRGDHLWKLLATVTLTIHWFNPLVWLAYFCAMRDMETSCDEAVLKRLGPEIGADYSDSLLRLATGHRTLLAFGEEDVKGRIRHILKLKRPAPWLIALAAGLAVVLTVFLAVDPKTDFNIFGARYQVTETLYHGAMSYSFTYTPDNAPAFLIDENGHLFLRHAGGGWDDQGRLMPTQLDIQARNDLFPRSNNQIQAVMDDIVKVYKADDGDRDLHCYLFVYKPRHWHNSRLYLAMGHSETEMRWLFQLDNDTQGVDLEYLDMILSRQWHGRDGLRTFGVYQDGDFFLVGWTCGGEIGISEFQCHEASGRRTYHHSGGVANPTSGAVSCLSEQPRRRYAVFATRDPNQAEYAMNVDGQDFPLQADRFPDLVVESVDYTLDSVLEQLQYLGHSRSPVGEALAEPLDEGEQTTVIGSLSAVYDLSSYAPVTLSVERLADQILYTNSTQITVTAVNIPGDTTVYLCDKATGDRIQEHILTDNGQVTFRNLTSAATYFLKIPGSQNITVTVSD